MCAKKSIYIFEYTAAIKLPGKLNLNNFCSFVFGKKKTAKIINADRAQVCHTGLLEEIALKIACWNMYFVLLKLLLLIVPLHTHKLKFAYPRMHI